MSGTCRWLFEGQQPIARGATCSHGLQSPVRPHQCCHATRYCNGRYLESAGQPVVMCPPDPPSPGPASIRCTQAVCGVRIHAVGRLPRTHRPPGDVFTKRCAEVGCERSLHADHLGRCRASPGPVVRGLSTCSAKVRAVHSIDCLLWTVDRRARHDHGMWARSSFGRLDKPGHRAVGVPHPRTGGRRGSKRPPCSSSSVTAG